MKKYGISKGLLIALFLAIMCFSIALYGYIKIVVPINKATANIKDKDSIVVSVGLEATIPSVMSLESMEESPQKAETESSIETETESTPETESESIVETETESTPETETESIPVTEAESEAETESEADPKSIENIYKNAELYPSELLATLAENPEMLDFVWDYPLKKDIAPATDLGMDIVKGEIPSLIQWDERWGYSLYGDRLLAINGCGPTSIAMVAAGLTGDNTITPLKVAEYSAQKGYLSTSGTIWSFMSEGCKEFGIKGTRIDLNKSAMIQALEAGSPIICSVKPGDFTNGGHFIVIIAYTNEEFVIYDSNSKIRTGQTWSYKNLAGQIKGLWSYSVIQ